MTRTQKILSALALFVLPMLAIAAGADMGQIEKQDTNWVAIGHNGS